jgi:hypothetical protein
VSNLYFPQLITGAVSQFPARKRTLQRTIINRSIGDRGVKMADPEAGTSRWSLSYTGLRDEEVAKLQELFLASEGRLRDFVWLDPFGNLLRWTEDLSKPVWQGSLQTAPDIEDPEGGTRAWRITNAAQAAQDLSQTVDAPGWYQYGFSVWVRSESTDTIELRISNGDGEIVVVRPVSAQWEQISVAGQIPGEAEEIRCSAQIPAASAIDIYGPQFSAQRDTSGYRKNTSNSGVYTARFDQDEFEYVSNGPNNHATQIAVVTVRKVAT